MLIGRLCQEPLTLMPQTVRCGSLVIPNAPYCGPGEPAHTSCALAPTCVHPVQRIGLPRGAFLTNKALTNIMASERGPLVR